MDSTTSGAGVTMSTAPGRQAAMERRHRRKSGLSLPKVGRTTVTSLAVYLGVGAGRMGLRVQAETRWTRRRRYRHNLGIQIASQVIGAVKEVL